MTSALLEKIHTRGYWEVAIRPTTFNEHRIADINILSDIVRKRSVRIRGWDFPHYDLHKPPHIDLDWVGQELEWEHFLFSWRLYQSGLFAHITSFPIDWRDQSSYWPPDSNWKPGTLLGVTDSLFVFNEIFEFAARLSLSEAGDDRMFISIKACNIASRRLYLDDAPMFGLIQPYVSSIEEFPYSRQISKSELISNAKELALEAACELFKRFGWKIDITNLRPIQERIQNR